MVKSCRYFISTIDIERRKNRLLKFCYVTATSAAQNRLLFFFLLRLFTILMKQIRQALSSLYSYMSMISTRLSQCVFYDLYDNKSLYLSLRMHDVKYWKSFNFLNLSKKQKVPPPILAVSLEDAQKKFLTIN